MKRIDKDEVLETVTGAMLVLLAIAEALIVIYIFH